MIAYTYSRQQLSDSLDISLSNEVKWIKNFIEPKANKVKPSKRFTPRKKSTNINQFADVVQDSLEMSEADEEIWNKIYEHALINPKKTMIEVTDKKGSVIFRSFTTIEDSFFVSEAPFDKIQIGTVKNAMGENLRIASTSTKHNNIYVAYPLLELKELLDDLFSVFLILTPIALAFSFGGGWFLAYKSLKPVDNITKTVQQITAHNLNQQIPERNIDDEIGRLISTFNDMIERLQRSFDEVRQFSIDASHELRTPLTIMRGEVELALRSPKGNEEYRRILASILDEVVHLSTIIDNLLTLSKSDLGQQEISFDERVNLKELMAEMLEDGEIIAMKKNISLSLIHTEDISIYGDRSRLRQLVLNLIDNAVKYTPEKGQVMLSLEKENGYAKIIVQDTGIGIPKGEQLKIFNRFYRVDKGRSREQGGSGLGLSIAKWIAEMHKGRIDVESEINKGSIFSIYLPL